MKEYYYDKLLNIDTSMRHIYNHDGSIHNHPYEPTSYEVLELLFRNYEVMEGDQFVDFGCGLGRFVFYVHYFYRVSVTGIEGDETYYIRALKNRNKYFWKKNRSEASSLEFQHCLAENYQVKQADNCFYFFNPFSIHIFRKVIQNILVSVEKNKRVIQLFLYYAHDDYVYYLEHQTEFQLFKEIEIPELYERDEYERILIYRLE